MGLKIDALVAAVGSNGVLADTRAVAAHEPVGWASLAARAAIQSHVAVCRHVGRIIERVNAGVSALGQVALGTIENARPLHTLLILTALGRTIAAMVPGSQWINAGCVGST
jgi:hypothetical protein